MPNPNRNALINANMNSKPKIDQAASLQNQLIPELTGTGGTGSTLPGYKKGGKVKVRGCGCAIKGHTRAKYSK